MLQAEIPQFGSNNETEKSGLKEKSLINALFTKYSVSMAAGQRRFIL